MKKGGGGEMRNIIADNGKNGSKNASLWVITYKLQKSIYILFST